MLVLLSALPTHAVAFADPVDEWKVVSLLRDRLSMQAPFTAEIEPPPYGFMEAMPALESEHLVTIDAGALRLIVHVQEMFRTAPSDFVPKGTAYFSDLAQQSRFGPISILPVRRVNGLELLESEPRGTATFPGAHLIRWMLVRQADDSLQLILFLIRDSGI